MASRPSERLYVELSASATRRRLKGHGFGVRRVESAGTRRAAILHTATGNHLERLKGLFHDVLTQRAPERQQPMPNPSTDE